MRDTFPNVSEMMQAVRRKRGEEDVSFQKSGKQSRFFRECLDFSEERIIVNGENENKYSMIGRLNGINNIYGAKMDITLIVGNGFDLALGLKTSYYDFYDWFLKETGENAYIGVMQSKIKKHRDEWSDFEETIGKFSRRFVKDDLPEDYDPWKDETDDFLKKYLEEQATSQTVKKIIETEHNIPLCWRSIHSSALALKLVNSNLFSESDEHVSLHMISLNYTDSLDQIAEEMLKMQGKDSLLAIDSEVSHPHGTLSTKIVLGVNDSSQIPNEAIREDKNHSNKLVKQAQIDPDVYQKCIDDIDKSTIICLYGISFGKTDNNWWEKLAKWLNADKKHKLFVFSYFMDETKKMEERDRIQDKFLTCLPLTFTEKEKGELKSRIFVYFHKRGYLFESQKDKQIFELKPGIELTMVRVEAGSFTKSIKDEENEKDKVPHTTFFIGETPVTQAQWQAVMGTTIEDPRDNEDSSAPLAGTGANYPMYYVSWHEAMAFCEKLNEQGKAPAGYLFTLPTETQWEYAAKGGNKNMGYKYSGNDTLDEVGWYYENSGDKKLDDSKWDEEQLSKNNCKTHEVKTKRKNELGLYDMSGNVWEWCLDEWPNGTRVCRGGGWSTFAWGCRVAYRGNNVPCFRYYDVGFRVVLSAVQ